MRVLLISMFLVLMTLSKEAEAQNYIEINEISETQAKVNFLEDEMFIIHLRNYSDLKSLRNFNYLGGQWIAMRWEDMQDQKVLSDFAVVKYGKLKPSAKLNTAFKTDYKFKKKYEANEAMEMYIHTLGTFEALEKLLTSHQIQIKQKDEGHNFITVVANQRQVETIIDSDLISFVEPVDDARTPLMAQGRVMSNLDKVQSNEFEGLGFRGEGVSIGVWDYGLAGFHKDMEGRVHNVDKNFYGAAATQHATIVAGAISSQGVLRERYVGSAPHAKVYSHDFYSNILKEVAAAKQNFNVYVSNHSYNLGSAFRCFVNYGYSTASVQIDQFAIDEPQIVNVFASGNSAFACAWDYYTIVPGFQYAKNVILVGNLQDDETLYPGSGRGPTQDGRLRPDVMAKGAGNYQPNYGILLPSPTDSYANAWGTSFSTPIVSGIVGLMQEAYEQKYFKKPLNTTVKAILCNSAKDLGPAGPDFKYGFGKADAYEAIKTIQNGHFFEGAVTQDSPVEYSIQVEEGTQELKVFLTWNDLPTSLPYDRVLVNDLDVVVEGPTGDVYRPLVLDAQNPNQLAKEGRDSLNNSEQIVIDRPIEGTYTIKVQAYYLADSLQDFSVAFWSSKDQLLWNYPVENSILSASESNFIRWRSNVKEDSIKLQYSLNGGEDWMEIGQAAGTSNFYKWNTPTGHHPDVRLRALTVEGEVLKTSEKFAISPFVKFTSNTICDDHIVLNWSHVDSSAKYKVLLLNKNNQWDEIAETTERNYIYQKAKEGKEYFFSVQAQIDDFIGIRANAIKLIAKNNRRCGLINKDIGVSAVLPVVGAIGTEYALTDSESITMVLINYSKLPVDSVQLFYQVGADSIRQVDLGRIIANQFISYVTDETYDFSQEGSYKVKAWVVAKDDTNVNNDTLVHTIIQKQSVVADFPYFQDFENSGDTLFYNQRFVGLKEMQEWDYVQEGAGRIYNFISSSFSPRGQKALTMDAHTAGQDAVNNLYLNIDLSDQNNELVYLDYKQVNHGERNIGDTIFFKGSLKNPWIPVYHILDNSINSGNIQEVKRINLSKAIQNHGQSFSDHSVLKFSTTSNNTVNTISSKGGYSIDDIHIYNGGVDLSVEQIDIPETYCVNDTLPIKIPVRVIVVNHSPRAIEAGEAELYLKINDSLVYTEYNSELILPFDSIAYLFSENLIFDRQASYAITVGINHEEDTLTDNNEITNQKLNLLYAISDLPLELNFDGNDKIELVPSGDFYSWEIGQPSKLHLQNQAENTGQSWVTNLNGPYPPGEYSHLYIGCLAPSLLNQTSEISFLMTYDLEYLSDAIWMEYSIDGRNWLRFGDRHAGYNWYNKAHAYDIWDDEKWIWETTSFPLTELVGLPIEHLSLRFTFETNEFVENEGVAIARLRLNNAVNTKINTSSVHLTGQSLGEGNVLLTDSSGDIYAQLDDKGQILGKIELNVHIERDHLPAYRDKFLMQRYYSLKIEAPVEQAYDLTLYLKNQEYLNYLIADHQAYSMADIGYLLYDGLNTDTSYSNNHFDLNYEFYVPDSIDFWPYMDGYELRLSMNKQSAEIYLTSNTPYEATYPFVAITDLEVFRADSSDHTFIRWEVSKEDAVKHYIVQHSNDGKNFVDVGVVEANGLGSYSLADTVHVQNGAHYYRIATVGLDSTIISLIDSISITHQPTNIKDHQSAQWFQVSYLGSGTIEIHLNAQQYKRPVFRLIDMSGKVIDEWKNLPMEGVVQLHSTALQRSAAAVYTLQMIHDHQSQSAKLVKSD